MDLTEGSETSAIINQTPGNYPKESLLQMKTFFHYTKHKMCQGMLFCKPAETVVKCTLTSYRVSIDYLLIFCILQFCGTAHGFLNSCYKFMHMFWNCGHILQIQTAYVTVLWFSVQKNWSTELGVFTQYGCNILVICGRDNNPVWKPLQRKILCFSAGYSWTATYILSQQVWCTPHHLVMSEHTMWIWNCMTNIVSHIESEAPYHHQKQLIHCVVVYNIGISYSTPF